MGSQSSERRRWTLVLDASGAQRVFTVRGASDADEVMTALRTEIRDMMARGGCRSLVVGVHVEGEACDHEVTRGSAA